MKKLDKKINKIARQIKVKSKKAGPESGIEKEISESLGVIGSKFGFVATCLESIRRNVKKIVFPSAEEIAEETKKDLKRELGEIKEWIKENYLDKEEMQGRFKSLWNDDNWILAKLKQLEESLNEEPSWYKEPQTAVLLKAILSSKQETKDETLEELEEKLDEREKKFWEKIKDLVSKITISEQRVVGGGAPTIPDDLSDQVDGSTKEFTLKSKYRSGSVMLYSSQFPRIYRPIIDFTEDGEDKISLTDEVSAPSSGQTLVAVYDKI